jgi:integral membrane protein (TIGR01906 family)
MKIVQRTASLTFILALPVLLITTNVRVAAGEVRLYERSFREHNAAATTGVALPELDRAAREIIHYFENDARTLRIVVDRGGEEISLFNARETEHMEEVKTLMRLVFRLHEIALAFVLAYVGARFLWAAESSLRTLAREALVGIAVGLALVVSVGAFALVGFSETWDRFHQLAFRTDLWRLNPDTDRLIQMFPEAFWQETTYLIGMATLAQAVLVVVLALGYLVFTKKHQLIPAEAPVDEG